MDPFSIMAVAVVIAAAAFHYFLIRVEYSLLFSLKARVEGFSEDKKAIASTEDLLDTAAAVSSWHIFCLAGQPLYFTAAHYLAALFPACGIGFPGGSSSNEQ